MTGGIILGQRFRSPEEMLAAKERYEKEQGVPYVIFNSTLATTYNTHVTAEKQIPNDMRWKDLVIACKHYGKPRQSKHEPGKQRRDNQSTFKKYCEAKFNICFSIKDKCFIVTKLEEKHTNHRSDSWLAVHYPEFRRVQPQVEDHVQDLLLNEAKTHRVRDVMLNSGVLATAQDVQNLRNRWLAKFKNKNQSSEDALFQQLKILKEEEPSSVVAVLYDPDSNIISAVFFQTTFMRESLQKYPELMIMDTTYKICDNDMPLVVFSVIDCFGFGRVAGYALIMCEKKEIVSGSMEGLKLGCDKISEQILVIYVDKAQNEIASIKDTLPNAEIHLCDFHVKDIFKRNIVTKLMKNREVTDPILLKLIHAHTKEDYDKAYNELVLSEGESDFMKYFNKNWHNSELVWSDHQRNQSCTLGERTTGKVECHNGKIKLQIDKKMPPAEVFLRLRVINRNAAIEHEHRVFNLVTKTKYHKYSDDPVVQQIMKVNTPFVSDLLKRQYDRSLEPPSESVHEVTDEKCDCKTFVQYKLICSHIFRERREKGLEIYDHRMVPERWTVIMPSSSAQSTFKEFEIVAAPIKAPRKKKAMCQEERFLLAESITKRISSLVANYAGDEFHSRICALQNMEDLLRMGKRVAVVGVDGEGQVVKENSDALGDNLDRLVPIVDEAKSPGESQDPSILIMENGKSKTFVPLTPAIQKNLKLPAKCPIPGRPKGSRRKEKRSGPQNKDNDHDSEVEDLDEDDVIPVGECIHCNGPVNCRTSFSKRNYGRKYILCASRLTDLCRTFHAWMAQDPKLQLEVNGYTKPGQSEESLASKDPLVSEEQQDDLNQPCLSDPLSPVGGPLDLKEPSASEPESPGREPVTKDPSSTTPKTSGKGLDTTLHLSDTVVISERYCFSCNAKAAVYTARTAANYGRRFHTCSHPINPKCRWISWIDRKPASAVSPAIKKHKNQKITDFLVKNDELTETQDEWFNDGIEADLLEAMDVVGTSPVTSCTESAKQKIEQIEQIEQDLSSIDSDHGNNTSLNEGSEPPMNGLTTFSWDTPKEFPDIHPKHKFRLLEYTLTFSDFCSLKPETYLNDQIIDCFVSLISGNFRSQPEASVISFSCLFLANTNMGLTAFLERAQKEHFLFNDIWIVPSLIHRNHWILFLVFPGKKLILILDPLYNNLQAATEEHLQILRYFIEETHQFSFGEKPDWLKWKIYAPDDVSLQENSFDCGLFVCLWALCLCSETQFPQNISSRSTEFRQWIANLLHSRAELLPLENQSTHQKGHDSDIEMISEVYEAFDNDEVKPFPKPWKNLNSSVIYQCCPDERDSLEFLAVVLSELYQASEKKCGAPPCTSTSAALMYLCEGCREWYHLRCIGDMRKRPSMENVYLCPLHCKGKTRTRQTNKPLRHRLSLS